MKSGQAAALVSNCNGGNKFHMYMDYSFESELKYILFYDLKGPRA